MNIKILKIDQLVFIYNFFVKGRSLISRLDQMQAWPCAIPRMFSVIG